ncbi:MAG: dTDP-4-dehydrorhamnose 3,5-epimerase [Candidatus Delongbacteria bacterium]|nr:dTDP-4-dehydrorhamnose 3,5-epimerase [Candidatus Delongbacteria bacterium]
MSFNIVETGFYGLRVIEASIFNDDRGYFFESFNKKKLSDIGFKFEFVQDNVSKSKKGVLRGLHYQINPMSQTKLISVLSGKILDVAVDLRRNSPTFGKCFSLELSSDDGRMILIPRGFAHGFVVLTADTVILYKCDQYYSPEHERGIIFNDPDLNISWKIPETDLIIAKRDLSFPTFSKAEMNFFFEV